MPAASPPGVAAAPLRHLPSHAPPPGPPRQVTLLNVGYVIDRTVGNTGGLGGAFGFFWATGNPNFNPNPTPNPNPNLNPNPSPSPNLSPKPAQVSNS